MVQEDCEMVLEDCEMVLEDREMVQEDCEDCLLVQDRGARWKWHGWPRSTG